MRAFELLRNNNAAETKTGSPESSTASVIYKKKRFSLEEVRETPKSNPVPDREVLPQGSNLWLGPSWSAVSECVARTCLASISLPIK